MAGASQKLRKRVTKLLLPALRVCSPEFAGRTLQGLGRLELVSPGGEQMYVSALERWERELETRWDIGQEARRMAGYRLRFLSRDYVLDGLSDARFEHMIKVAGAEHLEAAQQAGRGAILLMNHYGSQMVPSHWLLRSGYPFRIYMERPNSISKYLARRFAEEGPLGQAGLFISRREASTADSAASVMKAGQILKQGMLLGIAGDVRWQGSSTAPARFLGVEQSFTATWVLLAKMTKAPVIPTFCRMLSDGRFELSFLQGQELATGGDPRSQLARAVQDFLRLVEDRIRLDPANAVEYLAWPELLARPPARPDGEVTRAA